MEERDIAIQITGLKKRYRLGTIGGGTLRGDLQSWWARKRGKEDPNKRIGAKTYGKNETFMALDGIDLTIYKGERIGIIGHNGAGKSTLLKLLSRVTGPTEGEICLDGRISSMLEVGTGFNGELTGRENIYLNGAILGMTKAEIDSKIEKIIDFSEVRQFIDTPVKRYSSGMYVKLAFAVASHLDSEILIMDEVLAVGDMAFQKKCLEKMSQVSEDEGRTILYVSHNMNTIRQLCDRCIVMDHGKIIFNGDVEEAIGVYFGNKAQELPVRYDLQNVTRPLKCHGKEIHFTFFQFENKNVAIFDRTEKLNITFSFYTNKSIENIKAYFIIKTITGEKIGSSQTMKTICNVESGKNYAIEVALDISNIATGEYSMILDVFSDHGQGRWYSYDHVENIFFNIVDKYPVGIKWDRYFGSIRLNDIEIKNVIEE